MFSFCLISYLTHWNSFDLQWWVEWMYRWKLIRLIKFSKETSLVYLQTSQHTLFRGLNSPETPPPPKFGAFEDLGLETAESCRCISNASNDNLIQYILHICTFTYVSTTFIFQTQNILYHRLEHPTLYEIVKLALPPPATFKCCSHVDASVTIIQYDNTKISH